MNERMFRMFQTLILAALGLFLLMKVWDGRVLLYINQRFIPLVLFGGLMLVALAQVVYRKRPARAAAATLADDCPDCAAGDHEHHHDHEHHDDHEHHHDHEHEDGHGHHGHSHSRSSVGLWLLALPVLVGLLIPEMPLGTSSLASRGMNTGSGLTVNADSVAQSLEAPTTQRTVLDWIRVFNYSQDPKEFSGQAVDVTGFVYHDERLPEGEFLVGRFSLTCCVADAVALGVAVMPAGTMDLPDDTWVRVQGVMDLRQVDGKSIPLIQASQIDQIPEPEQPYLFP